MPYVFQSVNRKTGKPHRKWRFQYTDYTGGRRTGTGLTSKTETEKLAAKIESEHDEIRKGYRQPPSIEDKHKNDSFRTIADEYLAWGSSQGGIKNSPWSEKHLNERTTHLLWWQEKLNLKTLGDLNSILPDVEKSLRELQAKGRSGKTLYKYGESLRSFCNWCLDREYIFANPLKKLSNFDKTPKTIRRAMTLEEIHRLLSVAPPERKLLYEMAFCTGLRANELYSLTANDLDVENCCLRLKAKWTKNRESGLQPLSKALVLQLTENIKNKTAEELYIASFKIARKPYKAPENPLLFVPSTHLAHNLDIDLKSAGIPKLTHEGKIDFHACRVAYVTLVLESGANAKEAQSLARHSTPTLTMNIYARATKGRLAEISERVGDKIMSLGNITGTQREAIKSHNLLLFKEINGGSDGARTRNLCRDRAAL